MQRPRLRPTRAAIIAGAVTLLLVAAVVSAGAVPALAADASVALPSNCSQAGSTVTCTFGCTGAPVTWTVPAG